MNKEETSKKEDKSKDTKNNQTDKNNIDQPEKENAEEAKELSLDEKIKELEEKIVRLYAEMENQRRRYDKEKDEAFEYGGFSFAKEALNLLDNLERSKESLNNDETIKDQDILKKVISHLDIIYKDMLSIFKKNNIEPIKSIDQKLDPNLHQAMMEIEDNSKEPGTIVQEIQKGFLMKDRLLRPSLVGVSKKEVREDLKKAENPQKNEEKQ
ncbi:nucleotide exchange factor GrpE [Candidatus Pelagibacter sp.]|nr:nucleotide exchange factor GrpE [Candidatus Pelagibacter sp.]